MKSRLFLLPLLTIIALVSTAAYNPTVETIDTEKASTSSALETPPLLGAGAERQAGDNAPAVSAQKIITVSPDTLPQGRHQVSSYRNGESTEVIVEDGEIKALKINGEEIPATEYERHTPMVERLLGVDDRWGNTLSSPDGNLPRGFERMEMDLEGMEDRLENSGIHIERHFESMGDDFESLGERLGEMGERLGRSFERMFEFDSDGNTFRFEFNGDEDGVFEFDLDSLMRNGGGSRIFRFDGRDGGTWQQDEDDQEFELRELGRQRENATRSEEEEIREMETMIEKLERRKAEKQQELERLQREGTEDLREQQDQLRQQARKQREEDRARRTEMRERSLSINRSARTTSSGPDSFVAIIDQLREEGLLDGSGQFRKLSVSNNNLKVNGKTASPQAHARFLELYEQYSGKALGNDFKVKIKR